MAVRVITLANPAVGTDWKFTVPGQWLPNLMGVTAVLNTGGALTVLPDETATANNLTVIKNQGHYTQGVAGPFAGGVNNYAIHCDGVPAGDSTYAQGASLVNYSVANVSLDWWQRITTSVGGTVVPLFSFNVSAVLDYLAPCFVGNGTTQYHQASQFGGAIRATNDPNHPNGGWHHRAMTWDGVNVLTYLDGVLTGTLAQAAPGAGIASKPTAPGGISGAPGVYDVAGAAAYGVTLTGAQVATHAAANASAAAYRAAVLADTPTGLWMLSGVRPGSSRTVDLQITDGTRLVAEFPAVFASATAPSFTYSWQVLGPGASSSVDSSTITVNIPELALPPGYTVGSHTLDLAGTDQWSQVTLWFDDGTGGQIPGGGADSGYLNALLVPDYSHQGG